MSGSVLGPLLAITFGEFLWSLVIIFFMVVFFVLLFATIIDIFRNPTISGLGKAGWVLLIIILPIIGILAYLIVQGEKMSERWG